MRLSITVRRGVSVPAAGLRPFLRRLATFLDAPAGGLSVLFCCDREIAELNARWRGKPRPTDVLSFPGGGATAAGMVHLGDLAISAETARRQARRMGRPLERELELLLAHGLLHLLGYDHETDDGTMLRLQAAALRHARRAGGGSPRPATTRPSAPTRGPSAARRASRRPSALPRSKER